MNSTTYAKRTEYKPIDMFFRGVMDAKSKTKKIAFVDVFQVLNDRYLGRMNVCNYFAIAENSVRVNELNIIALDELRNYNLVMKENFLIPENLVYSLPISTRFLDSDQDFEILLDTLKSNGYKKGSLILAFYGTTLERIGDEGKKRYNRLRRAGYKTAVAQYGEDFNSIDVFANFSFDYLRCEAQYFDATPGKKKLLQMILKFCNANKITLVMEGVDSPGQLARFKRDGVKLVTGRAVSKLSRWVTNGFLNLPPLTPEKEKTYLAKLQKELDAKAKEEEKELADLRKAAEAKAKSADGKVIPTAPRPELAKSPYQVRLEQQRNAAKKAAVNVEEKQRAAMLVNQEPENVQDTRRMMKDMGGMRYEGDVQSALALSFAYEQKSELGVSKPANSGPDRDEEGRAYVSGEEIGVSAPDRPEAPKEESKDAKKRKAVRPDFDAQEQLMRELRQDNLFGSLGGGIGGLGGGSPKGFGVTLHIETEDKDEPSVIGHYNDEGQWVDEEGNVYNGYFDEAGKWVEYEQFDGDKEGHYNDNGQWVDKEGNVYDGYFDEEGRWIDYTYTDENSEIVDNGYFDDKLGKWVPYGYFDENGGYHRF